MWVYNTYGAARSWYGAELRLCCRGLELIAHVGL